MKLTFKFPINVTTKFDLKMRITETKSDNLVLSYEYNTDLFNKRTIQGFLYIMEALINNILINPKEKIRTLSPIYIIDGFQFPNGNLICDECISFVAQEKEYNYCPDCDERMPDEPMINEAYL